jgi:hypothetical protein
VIKVLEKKKKDLIMSYMEDSNNGFDEELLNNFLLIDNVLNF